MAITTRLVLGGTNTFVTDIKCTADSDTTVTIPHGLASIPKGVVLTMLVTQALSAMSGWAVTSIDATNIVLTKLASVGSANASFFQVRLIANTPHSLGV